MIEKEYIDLEETVTTLKRNSQKYFSSFHKGYVQAIEDLADIPAAKVAPVRHGRWKPGSLRAKTIGIAQKLYICSECSKPANYRYNFCPHCGAKMDLKEV